LVKGLSLKIKFLRAKAATAFSAS